MDFDEARHSWPAFMVRTVVRPRFATLRHIVLGAFLSSFKPGGTRFRYRPPGKAPVDPTMLDEELAAKVRREAKALLTSGDTTTLEQLMRDLDAWNSFRYYKPHLPLTCAAVEEFKSSAASKRRTGGSPAYKRRLAEIAAGRQKPMRTHSERKASRQRGLKSGQP